MTGGRDFEPAANHGAVQHRDDRNLAEFDALEGTMPAARMQHALAGIARGELTEIQSGAEMVAVGGQHHRVIPSGSALKNSSIPNTVGSSMALRFSGRARWRIATLSRRSARSDRGSSMSKSLPDMPVLTTTLEAHQKILAGSVTFLLEAVKR